MSAAGAAGGASARPTDSEKMMMFLEQRRCAIHTMLETSTHGIAGGFIFFNADKSQPSLTELAEEADKIMAGAKIDLKQEYGLSMVKTYNSSYNKFKSKSLTPHIQHFDILIDYQIRVESSTGDSLKTRYYNAAFNINKVYLAIDSMNKFLLHPDSTELIQPTIRGDLQTTFNQLYKTAKSLYEEAPKVNKHRDGKTTTIYLYDEDFEAFVLVTEQLEKATTPKLITELTQKQTKMATDLERTFAKIKKTFKTFYTLARSNEVEYVLQNENSLLSAHKDKAAERAKPEPAPELPNRPPLPPGWKRYLDPTKNWRLFYYYDGKGDPEDIKRRSQWFFPGHKPPKGWTEVSDPVTGRLSYTYEGREYRGCPAPELPNLPPLPPGWKRYLDPTKNWRLFYYYDGKGDPKDNKRRSQWFFPGHEPPKGWTEMTWPLTGNIYYTYKGERFRGYPAPELPQQPSLPDGWKRYLDPTNNWKPFYMKGKKGEIQWHRPEKTPEEGYIKDDAGGSAGKQSLRAGVRKWAYR